MRNDVRELYQEIILDHNRRPRNFGRLESPTLSAEGDNPLCGDHYVVEVALADGRIEKIAFDGDGCAISKASASLMTSLLQGAAVDEAFALFHRFHHMMTAGSDSGGGAGDPLAVLAGVRGYPLRVKCATLAWHTLRAALEGRPAATTE